MLFDSPAALIRVDMSEFMEKHSVARLIGAPPGYVGYEAGGYLTEAVRRRPYSLILLDEVEKAHSDVFNVLLQVLDDGRLTDGHGRTVDFRNTVLVMTSNLGSDLIQSMAGDGRVDAMKTAVMNVVSNHFRPEFLNRIDDTVVFRPLEASAIGAIAELQLANLRQRLEEQGMRLTFDDGALRLIAEAGYDPVYGARPCAGPSSAWWRTPGGEAPCGGLRPGRSHHRRPGGGRRAARLCRCCPRGGDGAHGRKLRCARGGQAYSV